MRTTMTTTTMGKHQVGKIHVQLDNRKQMMLPPLALFFTGVAGKVSFVGVAGLSLQQQCKVRSKSGGVILQSLEDKDKKKRKIKQHGTKGIDGMENRKTASG
jgi:hypothetical protein